MEFYEVEGTTLFHWRMTVAEQDEYAAVNGAPYRVASCVGSRPSPVTLGSLEHRVIRCERADETVALPAATLPSSATAKEE